MSVTWQRAVRAADALSVARGALGGLWIRARPGPARDRLLDRLEPLGMLRLAPTMTDEAMFGGTDPIASIAAGRIVRRQGLLSQAPALLLPMAERFGPAFAGRLAQALDLGAIPMVACDEASEPDEMPPPALVERLGMFVSLDQLGLSDLEDVDAPDLERARDLFPKVAVPPKLAEAIIAGALQLGISTMRAPIFTLATARSFAALDGRTRVEDEDVSLAAALCLAHRAALSEDPSQEQAPQPETQRDESEAGKRMAGDIVVDPSRIALPAGILSSLSGARDRSRSKSEGAGRAQLSARRGRPLPARPGAPGRGRIDAIATLRAAAPWQTIRRRLRPDDRRRILVAHTDLHLRRFEDRSERVIFFIVDTSGSAAAARLADAKGAIETLLHRAYAARDRVALVAFRGETAEIALPPTRSLVMAKRRIASLPGGGGTPLAAGLEKGMDLAMKARRSGASATLVLLTDGRANIARDGTAHRARAMADAQSVALRVRSERIDSVVVDCASRPGTALKDLATTLGASYLALPRVGNETLNQALRA